MQNACASVPSTTYGVRSLAISGARRMDEEALKVCLATQPRERTGFTLGVAGDPECGVPPFDASRLPIALWSWPWSDWPLYDASIFDRDLSRIARWYKARGFYAARVTSVERKPDDQSHTIDLAVSVEEGTPVLVEHIELQGISTLSPRLRRRVERALSLAVGDRFDEANYDDSKRAITDAVREASYALANVEGHVIIDPKRQRARLVFTVTLGRRFRFGRISIEGQGSLPRTPIWGAAALEPGQRFSVSALQDAKRAIYELGPFASVELEEKPHRNDDQVDILIKVIPGRRIRTAVGVGLLVGPDPTLPSESVGERQWDLHLLGKIEHRNFLGGMRRISVEDRPRLIFSDLFPSAPAPKLGNLLIFEFRQPAFGEARTSFVATARWDRGPDPYGGNFLRSDLLASAGPERSFLDGKLLLSGTINVNLFVPDSPRASDNPAIAPLVRPNYPDYMATYLQHSAVVDLRDAPREPRRGAYLAVTVQHAGYFLPSDWNYVRVTPDLRGYLPLPLGMVLAARGRIGIMEITSSDIRPRGSDPDTFNYVQRLRELGPLRQRLRGGGSNSVRGYTPNTLGDVFELGNRLDSGGVRQWEFSLELRVPVTASFGAVAFVDAGDVSQQKRFRFYDPQTTLGLGLRYKTIIGPLRLDVGFAPAGLQTLRKHDDRQRLAYDANGNALSFPESRPLGANGAIHFTIGEAF